MRDNIAIKRSDKASTTYIPIRRRRKYLAKVLWDCEGNIIKAAWYLGIGRTYMYYQIRQFRLWPVINAARIRKLKRIKIERNNEFD